MSYYGKYDLRVSLIKGVIKKHFHQSEPLCATTQMTQKRLLNQIKDDLKDEVKIQVDESYYSKTYQARFEIKLNSKAIDDVHFRLEFDKNGILNLETRNSDTPLSPLSKIEDILALKQELPKIVPAEEERYRLMDEKNEQKAIKDEKIKALKHKAIFAKITELAKTEKVHFKIDSSFSYKVKLTVRLSNTYRMEVDVLYSNYQIILQQLQIAIQSLKELLAKSVPIKVKCSAQEIRSISWTAPDGN